jgi:hypothetical protein
MSGFPGFIFDENGVCVDGSHPNLPHDRSVLARYRHVAHIKKDEAASAVTIWLLSDDATYEAMPLAIAFDATRKLIAGQGIVLLSHFREPLADVQRGLVNALLVATAVIRFRKGETDGAA